MDSYVDMKVCVGGKFVIAYIKVGMVLVNLTKCMQNGWNDTVSINSKIDANEMKKNIVETLYF